MRAEDKGNMARVKNSRHAHYRQTRNAITRNSLSYNRIEKRGGRGGERGGGEGEKKGDHRYKNISDE